MSLKSLGLGIEIIIILSVKENISWMHRGDLWVYFGADVPMGLQKDSHSYIGEMWKSDPFIYLCTQIMTVPYDFSESIHRGW